MALTPKKLKKDGIVEALFQMRFESAALPEVFVGSLVSGISSLYKGMAIERLPIADLPAPVRRMNPNLAFEPTLQLKGADGTRLARIGESVISWHILKPYSGWSVFKPEIERISELTSRSVEGLSISRLGLRYLNFLNPSDHLVNGVNDLTFDATINGKAIDLPMNISYRRSFSDYKIETRIATPEYLQPAQSGVSLFVDIDVHTDGLKNPTPAEVPSWVERAHDSLKKEFFTLLKPEIMEDLIEV